MNEQELAHFIDNATTEQKAVFNNNANGITIADIDEGSISSQERSIAMNAAESVSDLDISDVNSYASKGKLKDVPC